MFFIRMIQRSFSRQLRRRIMIAITICLSTTISVAMLGIVFDVGDKLNAELSTYGSNIVVQPKSAAVIADLYASDNSKAGDSQRHDDPSAFLKESDVPKIKTTFWAYNITNFAPQLTVYASVSHNGVATGDQTTPIIGTWFDKILKLPTGETAEVGVKGMRSWWKIDGAWANDSRNDVMLGANLAKKLNAHVGDTISVHKHHATENFHVTAIYDSNDNDNDALYMSTRSAQKLANLPNSITKVEVKALTTPENDLARKAARNPDALSPSEWETWYCTAYPSSIAYQIEEVIPGSVAKQVRQVAALQGSVLVKTQAVMILMTILSLLAATIAVANLLVASIMERSSEFALLKAIGASDGAVSRLVLGETAVVSVIGAITGALLGTVVAQLIGFIVFDSAVSMRPMVFLLVAVLIAITVLVASISSIRFILSLKPAEVLHGR